MVAPEVRELPPAPRPTDEESVFDSKAFNWVDVLNSWTGDVNDLVAWLNANVSTRAIVEIFESDHNLSVAQAGSYLRVMGGGPKTINILSKYSF